VPAISTTSIFDPRDVRLLTVGKPYSGNEIKIIDEGGKEVERGEISSIVTATGTINPVINVLVGSQVSGTIKALYADLIPR
jgi:HlyD family secretion protein